MCNITLSAASTVTGQIMAGAMTDRAHITGLNIGLGIGPITGPVTGHIIVLVIGLIISSNIALITGQPRHVIIVTADIETIKMPPQKGGIFYSDNAIRNLSNVSSD